MATVAEVRLWLASPAGLLIAAVLGLGTRAFATSIFARVLLTPAQQSLAWPQHDLRDCCARNRRRTGQLAGTFSPGMLVLERKSMLLRLWDNKSCSYPYRQSIAITTTTSTITIITIPSVPTG